MQKTLRFVAVVLFAVATAAVASTPKTPASKSVVLHEGSGPVPSCWPGTVCTPDGN
jgi:hypothetical protein